MHSNCYKPVAVLNLGEVKAIIGGWSHSLALRGDGTVWAWGSGITGALGDGSTNRRTTPVQVQGLDSVRIIGAGGSYSLALKNDGTLWSWGNNEYGQLGDGTQANRRLPVQINID